MYPLQQLAYLVATGLFIFSLHWMNDRRPRAKEFLPERSACSWQCWRRGF